MTKERHGIYGPLQPDLSRYNFQLTRSHRLEKFSFKNLQFKVRATFQHFFPSLLSFPIQDLRSFGTPGYYLRYSFIDSPDAISSFSRSSRPDRENFMRNPAVHDAARIQKAVIIRRIGFRRCRPEIKGGEGINEKTRSALTSHDRPSRGFERRSPRHGLGELFGGHPAHVLESRGAGGFPATIIFGLGRGRDCSSLTLRDRAVGQGGLLRMQATRGERGRADSSTNV